VLIVLLVLPGGLGSLWVKLRDVVVRLLTGRRVDEPAARVEPTAAVEPQPEAGPVDDELVTEASS